MTEEDRAEIEKELQPFREHHLWDETVKDVRRFLEAWAEYKNSPSLDTKYYVKYWFQILHDDMKQELSSGRISKVTFDDLMEILYR